MAVSEQRSGAASPPRLSTSMVNVVFVFGDLVNKCYLLLVFSKSVNVRDQLIFLFLSLIYWLCNRTGDYAFETCVVNRVTCDIQCIQNKTKKHS